MSIGWASYQQSARDRRGRTARRDTRDTRRKMRDRPARRRFARRGRPPPPPQRRPRRRPNALKPLVRAMIPPSDRAMPPPRRRPCAAVVGGARRTAFPGHAPGSCWEFVPRTRGWGSLSSGCVGTVVVAGWLYPAETKIDGDDQRRRNRGPSPVDRRAARGRVGEGCCRTSSTCRAQGSAQARRHQPHAGAQGRRDRRGPGQDEGFRAAWRRCPRSARSRRRKS